MNPEEKTETGYRHGQMDLLDCDAMSDLRRYLKSEISVRGAREILQAPVSVLLGVTDQAAAALRSLHIRTVFDLAVSPHFTAATATAGLGPIGRQLLRAGQLPGSLFDLNGTKIHPDDLGDLPLSALRGIGAAGETELAQGLAVGTLRELANWGPYVAAVEILASVTDAAGPGTEGIPDDLIPGNGEYPTERVFYERIVLDRELGREPVQAAEKSKRPAARGLRPERPSADVPIGRSDLLDAEPLQLRPQSDQAGFTRPAIGAVLRFSQSWYREGLTLGQLLHSVALAPGEMTRVAMVDWSRRTYGAQNESIVETEQLTNAMTHNRAIGEVTSAVAVENQNGSSGAWSQAVAGELGLSAAGILPTGTLFGASFGAAGNASQGGAWTTSHGDRRVAASLQQNIRDTTHQAANSARNRRASVVKEVSQEESEKISTRVVVNYNHMHAMTVQYYEVVQLYKVALRLEEVDRCLFIPVALLDFSDPTLVHRYRHVLAAAALDPSLRQELLEGPNSVAVTAPAGPGGGGPWRRSALEGVAQRMRHPVGPQPETTIHLPATAKLVARSLEGQRWVQSSGYGAELRTGETYRAYNWPTNEHGPVSVPISALREVVIYTYADYDDKETGGPPTLEGEINLPIEVDGQLFFLPFTITVKRGGLTETRLRFSGGAAASAQAAGHLEQHRLHYSQAIWQSLDGAEIASLLAPYHLSGQPLMEVVDPRPLRLASNYLVFRMHSDPAADAEWAAWLDRHQIEIGETAEDVVPLPSGGVHAEAVLGRANAAEKLDITRFWNWQDSPIPITAPEITAVSAGSRAQVENLTPGSLSSPVVNIVQPGALPDPQGMGAVLSAVSNGSMFRDMSGLSAAAGLAQAAMAASAAGASHASEQAGQNAQVYADLLKAAAQAAAAIATGGVVSAGTGGAPAAKANPSKQGALLNHARSIDASNGADGASPAAYDGASAGNGTASGPWTATSRGNAEGEAFQAVLGTTPTQLWTPASGEHTASHRPILPQTGTVIGGIVEHASHRRPPVKPLMAVLRAFIPSPAVNPDSINLGRFAPEGFEPPLFLGDDRSFDVDATTYRAEIKVALTPDPTASTPILSEPSLRFGPTHEHDADDGQHVAGKPDWWWELKDGHGPARTDIQVVTPDRLNVSYRRCINPDMWRIEFTISASLAATSWAIRNFAPAIDARLSLDLRVNPNNGAVEYHLFGRHDGFPAYELYLDRQQVYGYDPESHKASPWSLGGEIDVSVSTSKSQLDPSPGFREVIEL